MDVKRLIDQYGQEFETEVFPCLPDSQYGNLESLILYSIIRNRKPQIVTEFGTETKGRSTYIIHKALEKNERIFVHAMFDKQGVVEEALVNLSRHFPSKSIQQTWILSGPIEYTIEIFDRLIPLDRINFAFIDADHGCDFTKWYVERIIKKYRLSRLSKE